MIDLDGVEKSYGGRTVLGPLTLGRRHGNPFLGRDLMEDRNYSEEVAKAIDEEVRMIMDECYTRARRILEDNRETMDRIVAVLRERVEAIGVYDYGSRASLDRLAHEAARALRLAREAAADGDDV